MKIYTRTGDQGSTRLLSGKLVSKADQRLCVYGTTDELNSWLGLCQLKIPKENSIDLTPIQNELFNVGSLLACDDPQFLSKLPQVAPEQIARMENLIDQMTAELPPLKNFILPGGSEAAAMVHVARTVCRRAERELAQWNSIEKAPPPEMALVGIYLNRLSDYLFVLARYVNFKAGIPDAEWKK